MLQLPHSQYNLIHVIKSIDNVMGKYYDVINLFTNYCYFKKAYSSQFHCCHQNCNHGYLNNLKDLKKNKKLYIGMQSISVFLDITKIANFR